MTSVNTEQPNENETADEKTTEGEYAERGNWTHRMDFFLSAVGYAVGLGNVWRFPYRAYQYGGASFLIPYTMTLVLAGLPLVFLEMSLGQFSSQGPLTVWKFAPILKGAGWSMILINFACSVYYNMVIAYSLYYLFASFTSHLPWTDCRPEWAVYCCKDRSTTVDAGSNASVSTENRSSVTDVAWIENRLVSSLPNVTLQPDTHNCSTDAPLTPSEIYWRHVVLDISEGIDVGTSEIKWDLALCLLLAWIIVFLCLFKGIKSSGKVVYFTAVFPYVVLVILLIWNAQLDGAWLGIKFYLVPEWHKLANPKVWYAAGTQIFYSLGVAFGALETMASYNKFHNNCYRDAITVSAINCCTSVFAGFVIFSAVGFMAAKTGLPVDQVVAGGPGLAFIAYPEGLAMMPVAPLWSCLFFMMLFTLGIDSQFGCVEAIKTAIADEFPRLRDGRRHTILVFTLCAAMFLIGLPQCSRAGVYIMTLFDWYSAGLNLIIIALVEVMTISWIYGVSRFREDIEMMIGFKPNYYWLACWTVLSPLMMMFIFVFTIMDTSPINYGDYLYPKWADSIGWVMAILPLTFVPAFAVYEINRNGWSWKTIRELTKPASDWGPALKEFRTGLYSRPQEVHGHHNVRKISTDDSDDIQKSQNGLEIKIEKTEL